MSRNDVGTPVIPINNNPNALTDISYVFEHACAQTEFSEIFAQSFIVGDPRTCDATKSNAVNIIGDIMKLIIV